MTLDIISQLVSRNFRK